MKANNAEKMREALNEIRSRLVYLYGHTDGTFNPPALKEVYEIADAATSLPLRNCDVGTPEEQTSRWTGFCYRNECLSCPVKLIGETDCILAWSQMPYEEGDKDESN